MSGPIYQPPRPLACRGCGIPLYDDEKHECEVSGQFSTPDDKGHYDRRDINGRFSPNVKVIAPPSTMNELRAAADNLILSAFAYRNTADPIMKESMIQAHESIADLVVTLIAEKEGKS